MSSNKILLVNKKSSKKASVKPQVQTDASQTKPPLPTSQTTTKLDNKLVRVSSPLRSGPAKVAEPVNHSVRSNQMTSLQSVMMGGINHIDHKVTNIFKNNHPDCGGTNNCFGLNQTNPQHHLDVADDINAHGEYYLNSYPLIPIGTIIQYAGINNCQNNALDGWLQCNGGEYLVNDYLNLFNVIEYTYGSGCGGNTDYFKVPCLKGRVIVGHGHFDGGYGCEYWGVGEHDGEPRHTLTVAEMPSHNHDAAGYRMLKYDNSNTMNGSVNNGSDEPNLYDYGSIPASNGGNEAHNNMQPFVVMTYYIRAGRSNCCA